MEPIKITKEKVVSVMKELQDALLEKFDLDEQDNDIKLKLQKSQKRLSLAKEQVRQLRIDY